LISEFCQGQVLTINRVSSTTSTAAATTSLGPEPTFGSWVEIGCYTEATNSRALTLGTKVNYSTMDLSICADYCQSLNAVYFGVEYSGECYCGDVLEAGSVPSPDGGCVMPCSGNPVEICGGSDRLNVY
ncbi:WSC-domain-containing protein, partial [Hyaloscypha hepaticicola]